MLVFRQNIHPTEVFNMWSLRMSMLWTDFFVGKLRFSRESAFGWNFCLCESAPVALYLLLSFFSGCKIMHINPRIVHKDQSPSYMHCPSPTHKLLLKIGHPIFMTKPDWFAWEKKVGAIGKREAGWWHDKDDEDDDRPAWVQMDGRCQEGAILLGWLWRVCGGEMALSMWWAVRHFPRWPTASVCDFALCTHMIDLDQYNQLY